MSVAPFDVYFPPHALEEIYEQEGVDSYHARINGAHIRSVYHNIPSSLDLFMHKFGNYFSILLADALCENNSVETIGLEMNQIGDRGAKALAWALCINNAVRKLDLGNNHIGPEGIAALAHGPMQHNRSIVAWNLADNASQTSTPSPEETDAAYQEVVAALRTNKALLEYQGPRAAELDATITENRMRAELLAEIIINAPVSMTKDQLDDVRDAMGAVIYILRDSGYSHEAVAKLFARLEPMAARYHCRIALPGIPEIRASSDLPVEAASPARMLDFRRA